MLAVAHDAMAGREFRKLGEGRGLDAHVPTSLLVDRNGMLWVASREGLFEYDGYVAKAYMPDPDRAGSISDIDLRALHEADDGALWVSTNTGGLNRRDPITGEFTQFRHDSSNARSLSDDSVYGVAQDAGGNLWVGTQNGLNRYDAKTHEFRRYFHDRSDPRSLAQNWVYTLHLGPSKRLWIGTVGGGLDRWDEERGHFEHFPLSKLTGGPALLDRVFAIHEDTDSRVWAGTAAGLVMLDPDGAVARRVDLHLPEGQDALVTGIYADPERRLWLATLAHGILIVDPASGRTTQVVAGLQRESETIPAMAISGTRSTVFVGTWGSGVYSTPIEDAPFRLLSPAADGGGLRHKNVTAVLGTESAGKPWVGSFGGGPQRVDVVTGAVAPSGGSATDSIRASGILSLARMPDGSLYAGSTEGLYHVAPDGSRFDLESYAVDRPEGIGEGYLGALLPESYGLWVGTGGSGLYLRDLQRPHFRSHRHDPSDPGSLSGDYVTELADGRAGRLWVGTRSNGLNLCRVEPWSCERVEAGDHHVTALRRDRAGFLWVATDGGGLYRVTEAADGSAGSLQHWDSARGLLNDGIMAAESDEDGSIWLSTRRGLSRFDPKSGVVVNHVRASGLPVSHFNSGASSSDASWIYFGSVDGLLSIPKGTPLRAREPSPVRITAIESLTHGTATSLLPRMLDGGFGTKYGDGLALELAVLDYAETTHDYAYRLKKDDPWTDLGTRRQLTFFGLAPGHYNFEARGRDAYGQWGTSPAMAFDVIPPYWMTNGFRLMVVTAVGLLALGIHFTRLRGLRRRNVVLEQLERQKEHALERARHSQRELEEAYAGLRQLTGRLESAKEEERSRISRELHDEFSQTLTAAKINLQMLRRATADVAVAQRLEDSVNMVDGMIQQARDIARGLRPPLLDEAGLVAALDHHLKSLATRSGVRIDFEAPGNLAELSPALNLTIFRVVQEAVNNALRHAQAAKIHVTIREEPDVLTLSIEDDGVGFDPDAVALRAKRGEHLGLLGMTERVHSAGGTIELDSRPGGGSRIHVRIPLDT